MLQRTCVLLRRGKAPIKTSELPNRFRFVPASQKPHQGGQQHFQEYLLRARNDELRAQRLAQQNGATASTSAAATASDIHTVSPAAGFAESRLATEEALQREMAALVRGDVFSSQRSYNDVAWYEDESARKVAERMEEYGAAADQVAVREPDGTLLPQRIVDNDYFRNQFGFSLVRDSQLPVTTEYGQLDMWAELPQYTRSMYFLYIISRRRNTYAVCYDYDGKRLLPPYSAGNKGLKGGDRGFRAEGGPEVAHQIASMYLNDLMPKIREHAATSGRPIQKGEKVDVVLRVLGFYNGRAGAVRAVNDRSDFYNVRYYEDVTPLPMSGGPRMPRALRR